MGQNVGRCLWHFTNIFGVVSGCPHFHHLSRFYFKSIFLTPFKNHTDLHSKWKMIYIMLQLSLEIVIILQNILDMTEIIYCYSPFLKRFKYMAIK